MFTNRHISKAMLVPVICVAAPILTYLLDQYLTANGINLGFLTLALNGMLTFVGLWLVSRGENMKV
jgi:hypothetical protein